MPLTTEDLTLPALRAAYAAGRLTPTAVARELLPAIAAARAVFIARPTEEQVLERCRCVGLSWVLGAHGTAPQSAAPDAAGTCTFLVASRRRSCPAPPGRRPQAAGGAAR